MDGPGARTRRSTAQVRGLILAAARHLFRTNGYRATSTREIAAYAGVVEPMLFRHFGTKAALFERAVLEPFLDFISDFVEQWSVMPDSEVEVDALNRRYVMGLLALCREHRPLLVVLAAQHPGSDHTAALGRAHALISEHLGHLTREIDRRTEEGFTMTAPRLAVRFTVALVFGAVLFDRELFDETDDPSLPDELTAFVQRGVGYRESP